MARDRRLRMSPDVQQLLDHQVAVSLGQPGRFAVQEIFTQIGDALMESREPNAGTKAVARALLLAAERAALPAQLGEGLAQRARALDALELLALAVSDDSEGREAAVDAHGGRELVRDMALARVKVGRLDVQRHSPGTADALTHGRKPDFRAPFVQQAPELAGAFANRDRSELREPNGAGKLLTEPDRRLGPRALVAQAKRPARRLLLLEAGHVRALALAFTAPKARDRFERSPEIDRGFLEDLLANLVTPAEPRLARFVGARLRRTLPAVEGVDQVETGPGHRRVGLLLLGVERAQHQAQALVEGESRRSDVAAQRCPLLRRRIEREAESRLPRHADHPESATTNAAVATTAA